MIETLPPWLDRVLADPKGSRVVIRARGEPGDVDGTDLAGKDAAALASYLETCLTRDADASGGKAARLYTLHALDREGRILSRLPVRISPVLAADEIEPADDPADVSTSALLRDNRRHVETLIRVAVGQSAITIASLSKENARLAEEIRRISAERDQIQDRLREYQRADRQIEIESRAADAKAEQIRRIGASVTQLLPVAAASFAGKHAAASASADRLVLQSVAQSITQEQLAKLSGVLTPEQAIALFSVMQAHAKPDEPEKAPAANGAAH